MESLSIWFMLLVVAVCGVILIVQMIRLILWKKLSIGGWITAYIAFLPIAFVIRSAMIEAGTEYNPSDVTHGRIVGHYTNGDASLTLRMDGTYTSSNLKGLTAGTWSHFDWNLTFSGSTLAQPRWIIRRGRPAILPYYSGQDGSDGILLKKAKRTKNGVLMRSGAINHVASQNAHQRHPKLSFDHLVIQSPNENNQAKKDCNLRNFCHRVSCLRGCVAFTNQ